MVEFKLLAFCVIIPIAFVGSKADAFGSHNGINQLTTEGTTAVGEEAIHTATSETTESSIHNESKEMNSSEEGTTFDSTINGNVTVDEPSGLFKIQQSFNSRLTDNASTSAEPEDVTSNGNITVDEPSGLNPSLTDITSTSTEPEDVTSNDGRLGHVSVVYASSTTGEIPIDKLNTSAKL